MHFGLKAKNHKYRSERNFDKAELPKVGIFFRTQFPSLGIFINNKVGNQKKTKIT